MVSNRTAMRLQVEFPAGRLDLAPLESRLVNDPDVKWLAETAKVDLVACVLPNGTPLPEPSRLYQVVNAPAGGTPTRLLVRLVLLVAYASGLAAGLDRLNDVATRLFADYDFGWPVHRFSEEVSLGVSLGVLLLMCVAPRSRRHLLETWRWPWRRYDRQQSKERGGGSLLPWEIAGIGVVVPAAYLVARWRPGLLDLTVWPPRLSSVALKNGQVGFVAISVLSLMFVGLASTLPAMMYLQFDRQRLSALAERWLVDIFKLDDELVTLDDVQAKYGTLVSDYYGGILAKDTHLRPVHAKVRAPVAVATVALTIGWLLTLYGPGLSSSGLTGQGFGSVVAAGAPGPALGWFAPSINPATMGFLGAYVFCLTTTLRGYLRGDLRPKTYMVMAQRVLLATAVSWALGALSFKGTHDAVLALCFIGGLVPETVLVRIQRTAQEHDLGFSPRGAQLAELDGMDLYDEARLREEGITCVQALVKHRFAELMLSTRIPVSRLVDWVDRALLIQHTTEEHRARLAALGIRTATEVVFAGDGTTVSRHDDEQARQRLAQRIFAANSEADGESELDRALDQWQILQMCLQNEERLPFLVNWRRRHTLCCRLERRPTPVRLPDDPGFVPDARAGRPVSA